MHQSEMLLLIRKQSLQQEQAKCIMERSEGPEPDDFLICAVPHLRGKGKEPREAM